MAADFDLWQEYIDPQAAYSSGEFESMSLTEKMTLINGTFDGLLAPTVEQVLAETHICNGFHHWGEIGGTFRLTTDQLRPALEAAYDPLMPDWVQLVDLDHLGDDDD
jgi:hypothetical protein